MSVQNSIGETRKGIFFFEFGWFVPLILLGRIIIKYFFDDRANEKKGNYIKSGRWDSWKIFTLRTVKKY